MRKVAKPWGHEIIWAETERYVGKILHIREGARLSLQYHQQKDETIMVLKGAMILTVGQAGQELRDVRLEEGHSFHIQPGTVHRMTGASDCDVAEVSTPELEDVVRLADDFGREGTYLP